MIEAAVSVSGLSVRYGNFLALDGLQFDIPGNSFVVIFGPNGAGKSTFFKLLLGLVVPAAGSFQLFGKNIKSIPPDWLAYVPQVKTLDRTFPAMAIELVLSGLKMEWTWSRKKEEVHTCHKALEQVGALHLAQKPLSNLSGGELQRVYLARSIVRKPRLIMLDEPVTGIDTMGEADMYKLLENYQNECQCTVLMITHDWHATTHHADLVLLLNKRQIDFGIPQKVLSEDNLRLAFGHIGHKHPGLFKLNGHA
jgi:zinc transport system ATP-binding protein